MLGKKVNDPEIVDIDELTWAWHYASWLEDEEEKIKLIRNTGCFVGSFFNPEAARKIQDSEDEDKNIQISEEDFDKSLEYVKKDIAKKEKEKADSGKKKKKQFRIKR